MSNPDIIAENRIASSVLGATGLPLIGLTVSTDFIWSARFWIKDGKREKKI